MKIAIATILHARKEYCFSHAFWWMVFQSYRPVEHIIKVHLGEYGSSHGELKQKREQCRNDALHMGADALFFFDCDTIAPKDALHHLLAVKADVVSGIYFSRLPGALNRAVCWKHSDPDQTFLNLEPESDIDGAGMGCCLIRRRVLESVSFNYSVPDDDYPYWAQAKKLGFRLKSLNTLRCRHYQTTDQFVWEPYRPSTDDPTETEYTVKCCDGVTHNGRRYGPGRIKAKPEIIREIMRLDEPYRSGKVKTKRTRVGSVPGKMPGHELTSIIKK